MMPNRKLYLAALLLPALTACKDKPLTLHDVEWLRGRWAAKTGEGVTYVETWAGSPDSALEATAVLLVPSEPARDQERITLWRVKDTLRYEVTFASNPDKDLFTLTSKDASRLVFEDPRNEWPQQIIYERRDDDSMYVYLKGKQGGKEDNEIYKFGKLMMQ